MPMQGRDNESEAESESDPPNSSDNPSLGRISSIGMTTGKDKDKGSFWQKRGGRGTHEDEYETEYKYEDAKTANQALFSRLLRPVPTGALLTPVLFFHRSSGGRWAEFDDRYAATTTRSYDTYSACN